MERERRRAQILDVAKAVFAEKGYHDTKIDDIVARARVARGTFYLYFGDKRAIFEEIVNGCVDLVTQTIYAIDMGDPERSAMEQLTDNVRNVIRLFTDDPQMAKLLFSDAVGLDPDFDRKLLAFYDQIAALIVRALDEGVACGIVRPGDTRTRSWCLMGVVKEFLYQVGMRNSEFDPERAVRTVIELVAHGILTEAVRQGLTPPGPVAELS
jgi:AcrR family transcriptional regulator